MFTPPAEVSAVLAAFAPLFTRPSWSRAQALLCGLLLAPANQTVVAALRALGLGGAPGFQNYHRLLNRARWSARAAAGVLHKPLAERARGLMGQLRRWLPDRTLIVVADGGYAALEFLAWCARQARPVTVLTRLRLDATLYEPPPVRRPGQNGRPRLKGKRLPSLSQ